MWYKGLASTSEAEVNLNLVTLKMWLNLGLEIQMSPRQMFFTKE